MYKIRPADINEIKAIQELNHELFVDNNKYDSDLDLTWTKSKGEKYFNDLLNNPDICFLIAEADTKQIGYIIARPKSNVGYKSTYIEIENIVVLPDFRSKGIGKMLLDKCLEWAKSKGFQKLYVNSYFDNKKAIEFYKKNGFLEIDVSLIKNI